MRVFSVLLMWVALVLPVAAADAGSAGGTDKVDRQAVEDLIGTLESDSERQALIEQLQILVSTQEEKKSGLASLFDLSGTGSGLATDFLQLLESHGFSQNFIGDLITLMLTVFLVVLGLLANRWLSLFLDRRLRRLRRRMNWDRQRFSSVFRIQRVAGYAFGLVLVGYAGARLLAGYLGQDGDTLGLAAALNAVFSVTVVVTVFTLIWEGVNAMLETMMQKHERMNSSRFQTVTPIIRNILMITLTLLSLMVVLSEVGINIMPLLAGAGVLGIAVGFGAQTLVKDFLTGITVVFEDLLQIGDVVQLGDKFGLVEKITLRKVQLRDLDGTVHTVPFGEITVVSNLTKEFSYYIFDIGVAYREDVDEVIACLRELDEAYRADPVYAEKILEPLEILGVDRFADSAVMIKARYKARSHDRWAVGREFNRRIKAAFDARNIEIPFPHQTIYFGEDKAGKAPKANVNIVRDAQE